MRSMPEPMAHELSEEFWEAPVSPPLESPGGVLPGISCRLPVLPSGRTLPRSIRNSPGLMFYGRLLRGGVRRYRLQADSTGGARARRKRLVESSVQRALGEDADYLVQYGGADRSYAALDVVCCAVLEVGIMPLEAEEAPSWLPLWKNSDAGHVGGVQDRK